MEESLQHHMEQYNIMYTMLLDHHVREVGNLVQHELGLSPSLRCTIKRNSSSDFLCDWTTNTITIGNHARSFGEIHFEVLRLTATHMQIMQEAFLSDPAQHFPKNATTYTRELYLDACVFALRHLHCMHCIHEALITQHQDIPDLCKALACPNILAIEESLARISDKQVCAFHEAQQSHWCRLCANVSSDLAFMLKPGETTNVELACPGTCTKITLIMKKEDLVEH